MTERMDRAKVIEALETLKKECKKELICEACPLYHLCETETNRRINDTFQIDTFAWEALLELTGDDTL